MDLPNWRPILVCVLFGTVTAHVEESTFERICTAGACTALAYVFGRFNYHRAREVSSCPDGKIPFALAEQYASEVIWALDGSFDRAEIAGSIRRRKEFVGDIEILLIPKIQMMADMGSLFEDMIPVNLEYKRVQELLADGTFCHRPDKDGHNCCGLRFQRLIYKNVGLDLFCVLPPAQWGPQFLIRTGSSDFNKRIVRKWSDGGTILRAGLRFEEGRLLDRNVPMDCPEEQDVFRAIGLEYIEPWERDA